VAVHGNRYGIIAHAHRKSVSFVYVHGRTNGAVSTTKGKNLLYQQR